MHTHTIAYSHNCILRIITYWYSHLQTHLYILIITKLYSHSHTHNEDGDSDNDDSSSLLLSLGTPPNELMSVWVRMWCLSGLFYINRDKLSPTIHLVFWELNSIMIILWWGNLVLSKQQSSPSEWLPFYGSVWLIQTFSYILHTTINQ